MTAQIRLTTAIVVAVCALAAGPARAQQRTETSSEFQALIGLARVKRDAGDRAAARQYFEAARRARPFDAAELAEFFWVLAGQDAAAALAVGREALAVSPGNRELRDRAITEAMTLADETTVQQLAAEGQRHEPRSARWPRRLGESYLRQGLSAPAAAAFALAVRESDATDQDRAGLALALEGAGQHAEANAAWNLVPAEVRASHDDWERSRLRALAIAGDASVAGEALTDWLQVHPADDALREMAIGAWLRANAPRRALATLPTSGPLSDRWLRLQLSIARTAGLHDVAITAARGFAARPGARIDDRLTLAEVLIEAEQYAEAATRLEALAAASGDCNQRLLSLIDRVPDPAGTRIMIGALSAPPCDTAPRWLQRGLERAIAQARHQDALALLARLPTSEIQRPETQRIEGQLRLWTGDPRAAIVILDKVVRATPSDTAARESLVDAYRATQNTAAAWQSAEPLLAVPSLSDDRLLMLTSLALEADQPDSVAPLLIRLAATPANVVPRTALMGRALMAQGRPAEAAPLLSALPARELDPAGALALIDAVRAINGPAAACTIAKQFTSTGSAWQDVLVRRVVLESTVGSADESQVLRRALRALDANAAVIADAETALANARPQEALAILARISDDPLSDRASDLEAIALAGAGRLTEALTATRRLRQARPLQMVLRIREAELEFQIAPSVESMEPLLALHANNRSNLQATLAAAGALAALRRPTEALAVLGPEADWHTLPLDGRLVAAQSLRAIGRSRDALALLGDRSTSNAALEQLRAELISVVEGPDRAKVAFAEAATRETATAELFLKWAEITPDVPSRVAILLSGADRFPTHAGILEHLAAAYLVSGDRRAARATASRALEQDPQGASAWMTLIDATFGEEGRDGGEAVLVRFVETAVAEPAFVIGMAEHLSSFVRSPNDPLVAVALSWIAATPPVDDAMARTRELARARILATAERWAEATDSVDAALRREPSSPESRKLRAEILSWSGHHAEALTAYNDYLALRPNDVDARRQQARVAGWANWTGESKRLYAALRSRYPNDLAIAAEADAKAAFLAGRWHAAVSAYARWLTIEPENGEARFEYGQVLRADGQIERADDTLAALAATTNHRLAIAALARAQAARGSAATVVMQARSSNGYGGQRLLDLGEQGANFATSFGNSGRTALAATASHVRAAGAVSALNGLRAGVNGTASISRAWRLDAHGAMWDFHDGRPIMTDLRLRAAWRPADRWAVGVGAEREPLFENMTTIQERIAGTGVFADAAFDSPRLAINARASQQALSDNNARTRVTLSISRSLSERFAQLRWIGWAESLSYRSSSADYFSPARQVRLDAGLSYSHAFTTPRFRGDREQSVSASYLIGVDNQGATYHHPTVRLSFEFAPGLAIDAHVDWIRSAVYHETSAFVGLRIPTSTNKTRR